MSQLIMFQSGGFTNYGICYRKYSLDELKEIAMQEEVNTRVKTKETEVDYIMEIHKDMVENGKHWYTNSYDFTNGDRVKITVEILK